MSIEYKEKTHRRFYDAFYDWFMSSNCDFWNECDAPEELASIAVELTDAYVVRVIEQTRHDIYTALIAHWGIPSNHVLENCDFCKILIPIKNIALREAINIANEVAHRAADNAGCIKEANPHLTLEKLRELDHHLAGQRHSAVEIEQKIRALIKELKGDE